jgi:hypothetical protein
MHDVHYKTLHITVYKIMETLRNRICVGYTERTSDGNTECSSSVCLQSVVFCALVTVLSDSLCERIRKWETCPILKEGRSLVHV